MSLVDRIEAGFAAVAADVKALLAGKVNNDDQRLSDSREWTASVVSQAEAESGTSTTVRKWTSQRVRQAVAVAVTAKTNTSTQVIAGTGLTGGGNLSADRTLNVNFGTTAGTAAQGNDSRITGALQKSQVVQATGTSTTVVMSQKAVTDVLGQPSMTGSATLNGTTGNTVQLTNIVTTLGLEVGDVIRINYSGYNKLHTVESIANNNLIVVNYEHAGNRGNGGLKLADTTASVTVTRIAKWFNAPIGLGQAWVGVTSNRAVGVNYTNTTVRSIMVSIITPKNGGAGLTISGLVIGRAASGGGIGNNPNHAAGIIPDGATYGIEADTGYLARELR